MIEDKQLLEQLQNRDPQALRRLYEKYKEDLFALALSIAGDRNLAEDALQDVFVALARRAGQIRVQKSLKSYLAAMTINHTRTHQRKKKRDKEALSNLDVRLDTESPPDGKAQWTEQCELIYQALRNLPPEQADVIWLHLHGGLTFHQIAQTMGFSLQTAHSRYRYGLQKMKTLLNGQLEMES